MIPEALIPDIDMLAEEYVLIQAWKKTATYIRSHNWYADTLDLDRAAANLPDFLQELTEQLRSPNRWQNDPLRIVPAPKSQKWRVSKTGRWEPIKKEETSRKLRPLAHVSLKDQVAATAVMLCLADRAETLQGDPRSSINNTEERKSVVSYGNRLFSDKDNGLLRHRWGSVKLYRGFYQDYRRFLSRPEFVADRLDRNMRVVVVNSDLRQFYDRVSPALLSEKIASLRQDTDDSRFFDLAQRILSWGWDRKDESEVAEYARRSELPDFSRVALPQGLVAAGFFSNVVLLQFDQQICGEIGKELFQGVILHDVCRYVDDIRFVISVEGKPDVIKLESDICSWLQNLLAVSAKGLMPSVEKTRAAFFRGEQQPLVRQSRKMEQIQHAISGGFDAIGGEEILDAIQGLVRAQSRFSKDRIEEQGWSLAPIPDVRDETVARFAAARFRTTFRSLRPLLSDGTEQNVDRITDYDSAYSASRVMRTRVDLDEDAKTFALGLIEDWVEDPSNVRLLRIGLDLWPAADILERVLQLLRQYTTKGGGRKAPRRVAWYCLAEVFRAGATETGFVEYDELLPVGVDINAYRNILLEEAKRLVALPSATLPWYLRQQILLFLAANNPASAPVLHRGRNLETKHYRELIRFLQGQVKGLGDREFATYAILCRRSYMDADRAAKLVIANMTPHRALQIARRDPSFAVELFRENAAITSNMPPRIRHELCPVSTDASQGWHTLSDLIISGDQSLRSEMTLLDFINKYLEKVGQIGSPDIIAPGDVLVRFENSDSEDRYRNLAEIDIRPSKLSPVGSLYLPPNWCSPENRWRLQLGYLLRFILSAQLDFTRSVRSPHWKEKVTIYRPPDSHWYQKLYGLHSGHSAFGADWLPITDWVEQFLYALLRWPGSRLSNFFKWIEQGIEVTRKNVEARKQKLFAMQGTSTNVLMLPLSAPWPIKRALKRPLRICVAQTVIPTLNDYSADLSMSTPAARVRHRNHLSAALAAIERMLVLRETHKGGDGRLDLLVLPELSVHPRDIDTHLVPFARAHKTMVLAGLTYEELFLGQPMINSAIWLIPVLSPEAGLQIIRRRQGKYHLSPEEQAINNPIARLQSFRPCQWIVGYEWNRLQINRLLRLTASVCYDATDIRLAADLRDQSDIFIIPALNRDVNTFDQMALALHYHMYQMVIVTNNGSFGGSNAYAPYREPYFRQIFHLHGQPQASIAFLEIDDIDAFLNRGTNLQPAPPQADSSAGWKHPPAGKRST